MKRPIFKILNQNSSTHTLEIELHEVNAQLDLSKFTHDIESSLLAIKVLMKLDQPLSELSSEYDMKKRRQIEKHFNHLELSVEQICVLIQAISSK